MKPLGYLAKNLIIDGESTADFMRQWKTLDSPTKETLKQYAVEEMTVLGIE